MTTEFHLVLDSMTPNERERAEWITGTAGRGKFYLDGFEDGEAEGFNDGREAGYEAGYEDGVEAGLEQAAA